MTILLFKKVERLTYIMNKCQLQKERRKAGFGITVKKYTVRIMRSGSGCAQNAGIRSGLRPIRQLLYSI
jgi:hypothetical protein